MLNYESSDLVRVVIRFLFFAGGGIFSKIFGVMVAAASTEYIHTSGGISATSDF